MGRGARVSALVWIGVLATVFAPGCSEKKAGAAGDAVALHAATDAGDAGALGSGRPDADAFEDTAMPASTGEDLDARMRHLLEAIAQNNPDLAVDALFPRDAYVTVKDTPDPAQSWEKVSKGFRRSVARVHKRTKGMERARFVSFEVGHAIVQLTPRRKDFKKPLWRVKHSKLTFTVDGKTRHLDIAEMTAWRGAWYVTRLR